MGFRTVVVASHSKCSFKNGYMVIQNEDTKMIHLSEIESVIFETTAVTVTGVLLSEFSKQKIVSIFCDERHTPSSLNMPLYANVGHSGRLFKQIEWNLNVKNRIWRRIVIQKIKSEAYILKTFGELASADTLLTYAENVVDGDSTNREGFAAKVYFSALFGKSFMRHDSDALNAALDYGYSIIVSMVSKAIVSCGYSTAIGIHHKGELNSFNLSCDLMEPFRALVDGVVASSFSGSLDREFKENLWRIPSIEVMYRDKKQYLSNAIKLYCRDVFDALEVGSDVIFEVVFL